MPEEYEWEEHADMAVEELHAFINVESRLVEAEHELHSKLLTWDYVMAHLDERIPAEMTHLHELNGEITDKLLEIRELIESGRLADLKIVKEEAELLQHLEDDVGHKEWKAVKADLESAAGEEKKALRLEHHELKELHSGFKELKELMEKSSLKSAIDADIADPKQKESYEKMEEYYLVQIYRFANSYEEIFSQLWKKEKKLMDKLKKEAGHID